MIFFVIFAVLLCSIICIGLFRADRQHMLDIERLEKLVEARNTARAQNNEADIQVIERSVDHILFPDRN